MTWTDLPEPFEILSPGTADVRDRPPNGTRGWGHLPTSGAGRGTWPHPSCLQQAGPAQKPVSTQKFLPPWVLWGGLHIWSTPRKVLTPPPSPMLTSGPKQTFGICRQACRTGKAEDLGEWDPRSPVPTSAWHSLRSEPCLGFRAGAWV